ncbi:MAG: hypothetical protein WAL50_00485 [Kineosporiaceae bacterium]
MDTTLRDMLAAVLADGAAAGIERDEWVRQRESQGYTVVTGGQTLSVNLV